LIKESGYNGERIVIIDATDQPIVHSQSLLTLEMLKKLGLNAEGAGGRLGHADHAQRGQRAAGKGGWNIFHTWLVGPDMVNPAVNFPILGTGEKAWFGWPTDAKIEELREAWFNSTDASSSKKAASAVQERAFEFVPFVSDRPVHTADCVSLEHLGRHHRAGVVPLERREEIAHAITLRCSLM